jgi:NAD(P)-dependent dehydrogenase (short-subunit alcohol dehydrogenase family)
VRLDSQVAIITGAAQGIGREYALRFAREGAAVVIADLREEQARGVANEIAAAGGRALAMRADVTSEEQMKAVVDRTVEAFGRIDTLINNAAIYYDLEATNQSIEYGRRVLDVNLFGVLITSRAVFSHMKRRRRGSIINIASTAAYPFQVPSTADLETIPIVYYGLSKSGVVFLTKEMAYQVGRYNIRVNAIAPGLTLSDASLRLVPQPFVTFIRGQAALGRENQPADLTGTAVFLASDDSASMTGQTLVVDNGRVMLG